MKTWIIRRDWLTPALLVAAIGCCGAVVGCGSTTPDAATARGAVEKGEPVPAGAAVGEAAEDETTGDVREHHRHHHHGGFAMFIAMSLDSLGTTPDQAAAIAKIQADLHAKTQPAHDAEKTVLTLLADGVAAGKIDEAKVDAAIAQVTAAAAGIHDAVADALNQLHATLTPGQRAALVQKVEAHLEVWHEQNAAEEPAERDAHGGHLGKLAKDLGLSADQVEKIRASFKASMGSGPHFDRAEADAHMKAFGTAFESDTFDSKKLPTGGPANAHIATWGVKRMARLYEAVTPVLTADQRTKLAEQIRKHANYKRTETGN